MKNLFCLLLIIVIIALCGCSEAKINEENTEAVSQTETSSYASEIIDESDYYKVIYNGDFTYSYEIRDKSGNILLSENSEKAEPHITMMDENTVKLMIQRGTGLATQFTTYCNIEKGTVSDEFLYVLTEFDENTVYVQFRGNEHEVIIQNDFDKTAFYKEFKISDASPIADAITNAEISEDGKILTVTYHTGEDYLETKMLIALK